MQFPFAGNGRGVALTRVVSPAGVALLMGSADTCLTREAGQLARQFWGPNRVKPVIIVWLTPHKFGTIWLGRMTWLIAMPSISCQLAVVGHGDALRLTAVH